MQQCSLQPWTHCRVHVTRVAHTGCRQTSTDGQMLLFYSSSSTATALPACCMCVWLLTPQGFSMQRVWELLTVWSKHIKANRSLVDSYDIPCRHILIKDMLISHVLKHSSALQYVSWVHIPGVENHVQPWETAAAAVISFCPSQ
jgi:hypothetical protein